MAAKNLHEQTPLKKVSDLFNFLNASLGLEVRDRLSISRNEWQNLLNAKSLSQTRFDQILGKLGMNSITIINTKIDHQVCQQFLLGNHSLVPNKYGCGAHSTRRIGRIILKVLEDQFGTDWVNKILFSLQIGPDFFSPQNDGLKVNTEIYGDMYQLITRYFGFTAQDLYWLGQKTAYYNEGTLFAKKFDHENLVADYAYFLEEVTKNIEQSYLYELASLSKDKVLIKKYLSEKMQDETGKKIYGNEETCWYSLGFTTTVGHFSHGIFPQAKMTRNLYDDNDFSLYEIDLRSFKTPKLFYQTSLLH